MVMVINEILISNRLMTGGRAGAAGTIKSRPLPVHLAIKCIDLHSFINSTMVLMKRQPLTATPVDGFVFIQTCVKKKRNV
jgi:hypothetical protein